MTPGAASAGIGGALTSGIGKMCPDNLPVSDWNVRGAAAGNCLAKWIWDEFIKLRIDVFMILIVVVFAISIVTLTIASP
jgi:hypothetical protein